MSDLHASTEQLSRLIDGDLALAERTAVLDHVGHCLLCAAEQARLVEVAAALRSIPAVGWSEAQTSALVARLPAGAPTVRRTAMLIAALAVAGAITITFVVNVPVWPLVARSLWQAFAWIPPIGGTSALGAGAALVAISLLAPVIAYPLARWR